jgi:hypothetical protein
VQEEVPRHSGAACAVKFSVAAAMEQGMGVRLPQTPAMPMPAIAEMRVMMVPGGQAACPTPELPYAPRLHTGLVKVGALTVRALVGTYAMAVGNTLHVAVTIKIFCTL